MGYPTGEQSSLRMLVFSWSSEYAIDISVGQRAEGCRSWRPLHNLSLWNSLRFWHFLGTTQSSWLWGTARVLSLHHLEPVLLWTSTCWRECTRPKFSGSHVYIYSLYVQHHKCSLSLKWRTIESWFAKHIHPLDRMHYDGWHTSILTLHRYSSQGNLQVCKTWRIIELTWIELILDAHASCHHFTSCVAVSFRGSLAVPVFK